MIEKEVFDKFKEKNDKDHAGITTKIAELSKTLKPIANEFKERETINKLGVRIGNGLIWLAKVILALGVIYGIITGWFVSWFTGIISK